MAERRVNLLHVEDDEMQRRLIAALLSKMADLRFNIVYAATENEAFAAFGHARFDVVILDYQLEQGNGLKCLQRIRRRDPIVAIIAISGAASADVAKALLRGGADEFLPKAELTEEGLGQSIRNALARTDSWRRHIPDSAEERGDKVEAGLRNLCSRYIKALSPDWLKDVDALAADIQRTGISGGTLETLFQLAVSDADSSGTGGRAQEFLRPLLLELLFRHENPPASR
jgi:DNA-binding NarL/FixJ family response regulator